MSILGRKPKPLDPEVVTEEEGKDFRKPTPLDDVFLAFPARVSNLMPSREFCEKQMKKLPEKDRAKWVDMQRTWFFRGLPADTEFAEREGIDGRTAIRHLSAIQGSFEPKHEHKEIAVAYLASIWFSDWKLGKDERKNQP